MDFKLIYHGELPAVGSGGTRRQEKHLIRKQFHKQLRQLWITHPLLKKLASSNVSDSSGKPGAYISRVEAIANNFSRCGYRFVPIVFDELSLSCALDILFLRRDHPGSLVESGGDIDNRMKTLFDALRMPADSELQGFTPEADENPFYVLLQDDSLITKINISTDRLLLPRGAGEKESDVYLVIGVAVNVVAVSYSHGSNTMFLGS